MAVAQATPARAVDLAPLRSGVGWTDQEVPFQRSAKVETVVKIRTVTEEFPTAVQALADTHQMEESKLAWLLAGLGVFWIDQDRPFQRAASVAEKPDCPVLVPMASQIPPTHEIPDSELL